MVPTQSVAPTCNSATTRFGRLRNGGRPADPLLMRLAPRFTAHRKHDKQPCRNSAVKGYSVCRMHGARGGPKTAEGLETCHKAAWKNGSYSQERKQSRRELRAVIQFLNADLKQIAREVRTCGFDVWA